MRASAAFPTAARLPSRSLALVAAAALAAALVAGCASPRGGTVAPPSGPATVSGDADGCASPALVAALVAQRTRLFDALERGDRAALEDLLADRFVFVHASGAVESRAAYVDRAVKAAKTPAAKAGRALEFLEDDIRIHDGRVAVWLNRSSAGRPKAADSLMFQATDVLVLAGGRWRWVSMHSSKIGAESWSTPLPAAPLGCAVKTSSPGKG